MYRFLNSFLNSRYFDYLPTFLAKKIFKIFKIFFVKTNLQKLPESNHPTKIDKNQSEFINKNHDLYKPFNTCLYLLELLALYHSIKKGVKILDFGANNLDNYAYLKKNLKNLQYFYHDLPSYNEFIEDFVKKNNLSKIQIIKNLSELPNDLDFVFFGSSIHYVNNYREILKKITNIKSKYLIFSHTPFYKSNINDNDIVMKQVNIHPIINYAYLIEYQNFIKFMDQNNYKLICQNKNNFIKFLNFKNFGNFSFISFLDLFFERKD